MRTIGNQLKQGNGDLVGDCIDPDAKVSDTPWGSRMGASDRSSLVTNRSSVAPADRKRRQ